jgi:membrane protein DedA with SNARE-associated domain
MTLALTLGFSPIQIIRELGYAGLALLMLGETVFPPIPSEAVLPLAGYLVHTGDLNLVVVILTSTAGSVAGAVLLYEAARHGGRPFAERFLDFAHLDRRKLEEAEEWFARRGGLVVLAGRCVPGVRSLISLPAGVLRMPRWQYAIYTTIGSTVWNTVLVLTGYALGSQWKKVSEVIGPLSTPLLVAVVLGAAGVLVWRAVRKRRRENPA